MFVVRTLARDTWAVLSRGIKVYVTTDRIAALRVRDELERADRQAFYEGLIIGADEAVK